VTVPSAESAAPGGSVLRLAEDVIGLLIARAQTVAVAESLTGGLVAAALTSVPGSSAAFRGGVVAYASDLKSALLGVPGALLAQHGPVHPEVAAAMASGARLRLGATFGLATTGVAGPGPADGHPAGTVFVAVSGPAGAAGAGLTLAGNRQDVRDRSVHGVLSLLVSALREQRS
jgi:nicotinamide-nucleotide amidase